MNRARFGLLAIFISCLTAQIFALLVVSHKMWPEDFQTLMLKILSLYSIHLTIVLGGIFGQPKGELEDPPLALAYSAIILALLWNALPTIKVISFCLASEGSAADLVKYLEVVGSSSSFLVTGALAFFFTKGTRSITKDS